MGTIKADHESKAPLGASVTWSKLGPGDNGEWIELRGDIVSIHVSGHGRCVIEGSNTGGVEGLVLEDKFGIRLVMTAPLIVSVGTLTRFIRPRVVGDDAELTVVLQTRG